MQDTVIIYLAYPTLLYPNPFSAMHKLLDSWDTPLMVWCSSGNLVMFDQIVFCTPVDRQRYYFIVFRSWFYTCASLSNYLTLLCLNGQQWIEWPIHLSMIDVLIDRQIKYWWINEYLTSFIPVQKLRWDRLTITNSELY